MEEIFRKCAISDNMTPEDAGLKITGKQEVFSRGGGGGGGGGRGEAGGGTQKRFYTRMLYPEIDYVSRALSFSLFLV